MASAKSTLRSAKNLAKGYTDMQCKVREATSNDHWGPSGTLMAEIADATFDRHYFVEIVDMIWKRLNDSGKNWRHVFKALTLLDYCVHSGSDQVVDYTRQNIHTIRTLREFQHIDEEGKDQGVNVRQKSKDIVALISDETRLREERASRQSLRQRMSGSSREYGNRNRATSYGTSANGTFDEDEAVRKAIEESKRSAAEYEAKNRKTDEEYAMALSLSEQEAGIAKSLAPPPSSTRSRSRTLPTGNRPGPESGQSGSNLVDLFGNSEVTSPALSAPRSGNSTGGNFFNSSGQYSGGADPFGPPSGGVSPFTPNQNSSFGPGAASSSFGGNSFLGGNLTGGRMPDPFTSSNTNDPFGTSNTKDPFGAPKQNVDPFGMPFTAPSQNSFTQSAVPTLTVEPPRANQKTQQQDPFGMGSGTTDFFGSSLAFDGNSSPAKSPYDRQLRENTANAQLASLARNSEQIDPFANLAKERTSPQISAQIQRQDSKSNDPFESFSNLRVSQPTQPQVQAPMSAQPSFYGAQGFGALQPQPVGMTAFSAPTTVHPSPVTSANPFYQAPGALNSAPLYAAAGSFRSGTSTPSGRVGSGASTPVTANAATKQVSDPFGDLLVRAGTPNLAVSAAKPIVFAEHHQQQVGGAKTLQQIARESMYGGPSAPAPSNAAHPFF